MSKKKWKRILHFSFSVLFVLGFVGFIILGIRGVKAASCGASVATVTKTSSPIFYTDTGLPNAYASFQVTTGASGNFTDLWVKVDSFTNSSLLGLAPTEDGLYHVGALGTNSTAYIYYYFKGATTASAQSYTLHLYEGKPGLGGTENCTSSQSNTSVNSTISAAANKVNSVTYTTPTLGGNFTMTIIGDTGTIGNSQIFSYTPATSDGWNADCLELKDTQIVLTGGNTGTYSHDLYRSGLNKAASGYTITYTFNVKCVTASSTAVTPVNYISSGNDLKHTDTGTGTYAALPPIAPAINYLIMTKSVNPGGSTAGGNVTYSVNIINNGPASASLDEIKDVLPSSPANVSYITNTTTYDNDVDDAVAASSVANPTISGQTLDWVRSFTIASGKTARLTYQATVPSTSGSYVNSAKAYTASTQIDTTADTTDNAPATATYGVGNPSMTSSTKTASDLNGGDLQPGDTIEYTITATATGSNNATGVHISDTINTNTENLTRVIIGASSTNCGNSFSNNSTSSLLDITNITISTNTSCIITFRVSVKASATNGTTITNSASIEPSNAGAIAGYPSSTPMIVQITPILSIGITENDADNVVVANQVVTYTITITNTGQTTANGVDLSDTIAGPVGSLSTVNLTNCGTGYVDTSAGLSVSIASLSITTSTSCVITYTVTVNSGASSGSVTNTADITAAREGGNDPAAVSASTLLIGVVATPPNLSTTITDDDADNVVIPGRVMTYTITTTNSGQTDATTTMAVAIPAGMSTPNTITYTNCGSPSSSYNSGTLSFSSLGINAGAICTITFKVPINSPLNEGTTLIVSADTAKASQGGNDPAIVYADTLTIDATPVLTTTISENDADNQVLPSQDVTYTITISNTGDGAATGISLVGTTSGPIGNPSTFVFSGCGGSYSNNSSSTVSVSGITVTAGGTCTITYHVIVDSNATGGATINQTADASAATEGGTDPVLASATTLTVASLPNLSVSISDNDIDNFVTPGQTVTYTVTIDNSGGLNATTSMALSIPGQMSGPASFTYSNCGSPSGGATVTSISVNAGQTCTITFTATVATPLNEGTTLTVGANVAQASQGGNDPANVNADTLTVDATPNLSVTITENDADNQVSRSQDITYTIIVNNTGDGAATGISLLGGSSGPIGNPGTFVFSGCGGSYSNNSTFTVSVSGIAVTSGGSCTITYHVFVDANAAGASTITQSIDASAATEGGNNPSVENATNLTVTTLPNLSVNISDNDADNYVNPGQTVTYTVTITNSSQTDATTSMALSIPGQMSGPASFTYSNCGSPSGGVTVTSISILQGQTCTINFTATVATPLNEGTTLTVGADVAQASQGGNDPANVNADTLTVDATPILTTTITENDSDNLVYPNQDITYTINITNTGDGAASGINLVSTSSGSIGSPGSFSFSGCGGSYTNNSTSTVDISGITITAGGTCTITYHVTVDSNASGGSITQTADASAATEGGNNPAVANATTLTIATLPDLSVGISDSDSDNIVTPGQVVTYTVTITNSGQTNATTSMALSIPGQMSGPASFSYSNCGSPSGGATVTSISVSAGQTCTITFTATVATPLNEGTTLTVGANVAQASQGGNDPANVNADTLTVDATPNLSPSAYVISDINGGTLQPGDVVNYILTIKNIGDGTASGVDVGGAINSNVTLDTNSFSYTNCGSGPTSSSSANSLSLHDIEIAVGTDCVITFQVTLKSPINEGTTITETATINGVDQGGVSANVESNTLSTDATPNLSTSYIETVDVNGATPKPGEKIAYTIHVINNGDGDGSGISLTSALSEYLSIATGSFTFENCGSSYTNSSTATSLSFSNLSVSTTTECTIYFEAFLQTPINDGTQVFFDTTISPASEGGPGATPSSEKLIIDSTPFLGVVIFNDDEDGTVFLDQSVHTHIEIANFGDGRATGVTTSYRYSGSISSFSNIQFGHCGSSASYEAVAGGYDFKNLEITTSNDCVIQFDFLVSNDAPGGSTIDQSADATAASEGGLKPDTAYDTTLTVNSVNHAPDIPSNVITSIFSGGKYLNDSAMAGAQLSSDLIDPDDNDQVRYRIQIATDPLFNNVVIDYRSTFADEGNRTYTYKETGGTYVTGSSSTVLSDGPYYVQIRNEDIGGANSAWYKIDGVAFNYDNTPPVKPPPPFVIGDIGKGFVNVGWDVTEEPSPDPVLPYRLEFSDDPSFATFDVLDSGDVSSYFSGLPLGSTKYFRIIWLDNAGNYSEPSDILAVKIPEDNTGGGGGTITPPAPTTPTIYPSIPATTNVTTPTNTTTQNPTEPSKLVVQNITVVMSVTDGRGSPIENAKVVLTDKNNQTREGYTGKDGLVIFEGMPLGNYSAQVNYKNYSALTRVNATWGTQKLFVRVVLNVGLANWSWMYVMLVFLFIYLLWLDYIRHYSIWPITHVLKRVNLR